MSSSSEIRFQIRTNKDEKAYLLSVARLCGFKTLSEFMRVSAYEKAKRELQDIPSRDHVKSRKLSSRDSLLLAEAILGDREPNEALKSLCSQNNEAILESLLSKEK